MVSKTPGHAATLPHLPLVSPHAPPPTAALPAVRLIQWTTKGNPVLAGLLFACGEDGEADLCSPVGVLVHLAGDSSHNRLCLWLEMDALPHQAVREMMPHAHRDWSRQGQPGWHLADDVYCSGYAAYLDGTGMGRHTQSPSENLGEEAKSDNFEEGANSPANGLLSNAQRRQLKRPYPTTGNGSQTAPSTKPRLSTPTPPTIAPTATPTASRPPLSLTQPFTPPESSGDSFSGQSEAFRNTLWDSNSAPKSPPRSATIPYAVPGTLPEGFQGIHTENPNEGLSRAVPLRFLPAAAGT